MFWPLVHCIVSGDNKVFVCCLRKKLLSILLSSKMLLVTHQLSVLSRDMFSSKCVYRTYAETSLLASRPLPSSCVEKMEHQTQSPRLCLCWVRLAGGLPTASCWTIVWTVASSFWHHSMTRHIDGWACPTRLKNYFRLFCGMMEGLAFLPVPDLTIGIHLLRTLCPDDPPEGACPTRLKNLLFQPSHMLLVLASPLTVVSCTFQMAGGNIGGLRLKTRRTAWFCAVYRFIGSQK
jgi:hypothetical protein